MAMLAFRCLTSTYACCVLDGLNANVYAWVIPDWLLYDYCVVSACMQMHLNECFTNAEVCMCICVYV